MGHVPHFKKIGLTLLVSIQPALWTACATSPLGRNQLMLVDDNSMNQMGAQAFNELKTKTPVTSNTAVTAYVRCVALPITQAAAGQTPVSQWEIQAFESPQVNAFA